MTRYIFNTLTVLSLLLLLATVGLWVAKNPKRMPNSDYLFIYALLSILPVLWFCNKTLHSAASINVPMFRYLVNRVSTVLGIVSFAMLAIGVGIEIATHQLWFDGYLSTFSGWMFIFIIIAFLSRTDNQCPHCTYDLTGNQTGVCTECGVGVTPNSK